jgi:hypothetical protein
MTGPPAFLAGRLATERDDGLAGARLRVLGDERTVAPAGSALPSRFINAMTCRGRDEGDRDMGAAATTTSSGARPRQR